MLSPKRPRDTIYDKALSPGKRPQPLSWSLHFISVFPLLPTLHSIYSISLPFHFMGSNILPHHLLNQTPPAFYSISLCAHDQPQTLVIIIWPANKDKGFLFWSNFQFFVQRPATLQNIMAPDESTFHIPILTSWCSELCGFSVFVEWMDFYPGTDWRSRISAKDRTC